jgi:tyrosine-specific transport protein
MIKNKSKALGGILLVSGTAIGAGMLALPITTASSGFIPTFFAFLVCWFFMTVAALLLLEVNLKLAGEKDLISMVSVTLGRVGKIIAWICYLMLLYALICAYLKGGSAWVVKVLADLHISLSVNWAILILIFVFATIVSYGTAITEKINRVFMAGLIFAYIVLIICGLPSVDLTKLTFANPAALPPTFPLLLTAFGFSIILPSLTNYLERDVHTLRWVVILGSLLPFAIYFLWEFISLGIIPPTGPISFEVLAQRHDDGTGVAVALEQIVGNPWITSSGQWFAIFAILTSLLGVSLALFHFLVDGLELKNKKTLLHRLLLCALTYVPPLAILLFYPSSFGRILSFAGIFVAVLMGLIPTLMVWRSRYSPSVHTRFPGKYRVFGGRALLIAVMLFFLYIIYLEFVNCFACS